MGSTWLNSADAAYPAMARIYSVHEAIKNAANSDLYIESGNDVVASATTGKIKVNKGFAFMSGVEVISLNAQDTIDCASNADATNPRWAIVELNTPTTAGSVNAQLNLGTAAANPVPPVLTAGTVPLALIYIPAGATAVDALTSTANGKCKIIDCRQIKSIRRSRSMGGANSVTATVTLDSSAKSILNNNPLIGLGPVTLPGYSTRSSDIYQITASGRLTLPTTNATFTIAITMTTPTPNVYTLFTYTTPSLTASSVNRHWTLSCNISAGATVPNWYAYTQSNFLLTPASNTTTSAQMNYGVSVASTPITTSTTGGGINGDYAIGAGQILVDFYKDMDIDVTAKVSAGTDATISLRQFSVVKFPSVF